MNTKVIIEGLVILVMGIGVFFMLYQAEDITETSISSQEVNVYSEVSHADIKYIHDELVDITLGLMEVLAKYDVVGDVESDIRNRQIVVNSTVGYEHFKENSMLVEEIMEDIELLVKEKDMESYRINLIDIDGIPIFSLEFK
ncbi:hypothetical protein ACFSCX_13670 [Bacillus salitolerans]|uniref:Uncharacterized protein n=1 Tax=Bacillus salitolerans TaxID=1437434 RepID=A0ABW4LR24_9BACI